MRVLSSGGEITKCQNEKGKHCEICEAYESTGISMYPEKIGDTNAKFWIGVKIKSRIDRDVIPMGQTVSRAVSALTRNQGQND